MLTLLFWRAAAARLKIWRPSMTKPWPAPLPLRGFPSSRPLATKPISPSPILFPICARPRLPPRRRWWWNPNTNWLSTSRICIRDWPAPPVTGCSWPNRSLTIWRGTARLRHFDFRSSLVLNRTRLDAATETLVRAVHARLLRQKSILDQHEARLQALSPVKILDRGYALIFDASGALVKDSEHLKQGDRISARVSHGTFTAEVLKPE